MSLKLENVVKQYGLQPAIHQLSLEIQPGELVALLGPSGCGKTTLLRSLAGLESLRGGRIWFGDQEASQLSVQERRVGFVFQHYALFRHLTVFENVAFGLRLLPRKQRPSRQAIEETVTALLERAIVFILVVMTETLATMILLPDATMVHVLTQVVST